MKSTKLRKISKEVIRFWTKSAKQCYLIGGMCEKCTVLPEDLKEQCRMKECVILLVEKLGKPF